MAILTYKQAVDFKNNFFSTRTSELFGISLAVMVGLNFAAFPFLAAITGLALMGVAIFNLVKFSLFADGISENDRQHETFFAYGLFAFSLMIFVLPLIAVPLGCYAMYRSLPDNPDFEGLHKAASTGDQSEIITISPEAFKNAFTLAVMSTCKESPGSPPVYSAESSVMSPQPAPSPVATANSRAANLWEAGSTQYGADDPAMTCRQEAATMGLNLTDDEVQLNASLQPAH